MKRTTDRAGESRQRLVKDLATGKTPDVKGGAPKATAKRQAQFEKVIQDGALTDDEYRSLS